MSAATVPTFEEGLLLRRSFSLPTGRYDEDIDMFDATATRSEDSPLSRSKFGKPQQAATAADLLVLRRDRRAFKAISAKVVRQLAVVQRLKQVALASRSSKEGREGGKENFQKQKKVRVAEEFWKKTPFCTNDASEPPFSSLVDKNGEKNNDQDQEQLPAWYRSLSQVTKSNTSKSPSLSASSSVGDFFRTSSSISNAHSSQDVDEYMRNLCSDSIMCKRHALRALWKLYFFAFPRKVVNIKSHEAPAQLNTQLLLSLMREDCQLNQPVAFGRDEVIKVLDNFEGTEMISAELVHNYVDEENSVTFSEYILQFANSGRYLKICEVISWDLSQYEMDSGGNAYDREALLRGDLPAIAKVMYYGKDTTLLPNDQLPVAEKTVERVPLRLLEKYSEKYAGCKFIEAVSSYVEALMCNDLSSIYDMLCSNFRISSFDGVKTRDGFIAWLKTLEMTANFKRKMENVFVDHKSKTAFLHLIVQCGATSAVVLNVVQWDVEAECIIAIREYGTVFKIIA